MRYLQSGYSAAWLARLSGGQKVASSNLAVPTIASYARHWLSHWWAFFAHDSAERSEACPDGVPALGR